jgi:hypothetical protein
MIGVAQFGIALSALGAVLAFMGLFPGVTGIEPGLGVGIVQYVTIFIGFALLDLGALIYAKYTFYPDGSANFAQQIGIRLTLTGLLLGGIAGLADFLGFGSHMRTEITDVVFGPLQAIAAVGGLVVAALGIVLYAATGEPPSEGDE